MIFCGAVVGGAAGFEALKSTRANRLEPWSSKTFPRKRKIGSGSHTATFQFTFYRSYYNLLKMVISLYLQVTLTFNIYQHYIIKIETECH